MRRLFALLLGTVIGLGLAEGLARTIAPAPAEELFFGGFFLLADVLYRPVDVLLREPIPGAIGTFDPHGVAVAVRFNQLGTRGGEVPAGPAWLAVGDSFTLGVQVPEDDTFVARLSARANIPVLNGGVDDFSTFQAARRYVKLAASRDVDRVIYTFYLGNDLVDNERYLHLLSLPVPAIRPPAPNWSSELYRRSVLLTDIRVALTRRAVRVEGSEDGRRFRKELLMFTKSGAYRRELLRRVTHDALVELRDAAAARGDALLVAVAPPSYSLDPAMIRTLLDDFELDDPEPEAPREMLLAELASLGIPSCDLTPALRAAAADGRRTYLRFDGHWNTVGHTVVADALAGCLGVQ